MVNLNAITKSQKLKMPDFAPKNRTLPSVYEIEDAVEHVMQMLLGDDVRIGERNSGGVVVMTGAGVSTDSGIPDYRGEQGTYTVNANYKPIYFQEFLARHSFRQRYWARGYLGWGQIHDAKPNSTHLALKSLQDKGYISNLITQNVDRLHLVAGSPEDRVAELHGTLATVECLSCGHKQPRDVFQDVLSELNPEWAAYRHHLKTTHTEPRINPDGDVELPANVSYYDFEIPPCPKCHTGIVKPSVVFFGENIKADVKALTSEWIRQARAILVIGSSLATYSAYRLVKTAHEMGKEVGLVNIGATRGDDIASWKCEVACGEVFPVVTKERVCSGSLIFPLLDKHVVVVGAGVGGVATAARLASQGIKVTVVEKNDFVGGRCSLLYQDGHRFDQGPSLYLMPKIFKETFDDLGHNIEDHIDLLKCERNYRVHFHDGDSIQLSPDLSIMKKEIERYEGEGVEPFLCFLRFIEESHIHYERSVQLALKQNFVYWWHLFRLKYIPDVFRLHLVNTIYGRAKKYFQSKKVRMALTFQTMYMSMSPFEAPANYNLLQYTEFAEGIWYPRGGFNIVPSALAKIAESYGATIRLNCPVKSINTTDRSVTGVTLADGEVIEADAVIANADLVYVYNTLLPPSTYGKRLSDKAKYTSSSISFYWCLDREVPELDVHNIFLAEAYKESFDEIFKDLSLPSDPSFYVNVPSRIDPSSAPPGRDTVVVLVPIGHSRHAIPEDQTEMVKKARQMVIGTITKRLQLPDFSSYVVHETVNDPSTWASRFNLWKGSILGRFDNLFFVGASAHPGTGVPIVLCCAKLVSEQVGQWLGIDVRWSKKVKGANGDTRVPAKRFTFAYYIVTDLMPIALVVLAIVWLLQYICIMSSTPRPQWVS
ncbi:hypothetical protein BZG36_00431 [Bifiguratus adelaidae]|uniref:Phytoene desaturase n=1 Tax=Bifiguratus adelaidae TaxID=1938954 RepID=A0A261Y7W9_9FUNG|nr:hypothetical protein BZG36_00431 [Bifiguratus adelaidae]